MLLYKRASSCGKLLTCIQKECLQNLKNRPSQIPFEQSMIDHLSVRQGQKTRDSKTRIGTVTSLWVPFYLDCLFLKDIASSISKWTHISKMRCTKRPSQVKNPPETKSETQGQSARKKNTVYFNFLCIGKVLSSSVYFNSNVWFETVDWTICVSF